MKTSISKEEILIQLIRQLESFFLLSEGEKMMLFDVFENVLSRCRSAFEGDGKYMGEIPQFSPYHSVKYMIFLYVYSNELFKVYGRVVLCDKVYYLNKIMNSVDIFYEVEMPLKWFAEHPVGSVMGRAKYGENFFFYQGCTVGGFHKKDATIDYPIIGNNVRMFANSSIIGNCIIGDNVKVGAGVIIKNQNVPSNSVVFGSSPNLIIKSQK